MGDRTRGVATASSGSDGIARALLSPSRSTEAGVFPSRCRHRGVACRTGSRLDVSGRFYARPYEGRRLHRRVQPVLRCARALRAVDAGMALAGSARHGRECDRHPFALGRGDDRERHLLHGPDQRCEQPRGAAGAGRVPAGSGAHGLGDEDQLERTSRACRRRRWPSKDATANLFSSNRTGRS